MIWKVLDRNKKNYCTTGSLKVAILMRDALLKNKGIITIVIGQK